MISFLDLQKINARHRQELSDAMTRVLDSGWFVLGPETQNFEQNFAKYCGATECVGVGNGLDAIKIALIAHGIGKGDEVIVPSHTFIATWLAVSQVGAIPVPVEPDSKSLNIDPIRIRKAITPRTRAIIAVHLYGQAADIDAIDEIAFERNLVIIEDAAQAHGAVYRKRRIGGHRHTVAWSFYPGKNLGALGDGGAITTHDPKIASRLRELRNYGSEKKYHHTHIGYNTRLDEIQAAILNVKLQYLDDDNKHRQLIAKQYLENLQDCNLILPNADNTDTCAWHLFVIQTPLRDSLQQRLQQHGISTLVHYPCAPHLQPAYSSLNYSIGSFPIAEKLQDTVLSLPISPLQSKSETDEIIKVIQNYL